MHCNLSYCLLPMFTRWKLTTLINALCNTISLCIKVLKLYQRLRQIIYVHCTRLYTEYTWVMSGGKLKGVSLKLTPILVKKNNITCWSVYFHFAYLVCTSNNGLASICIICWENIHYKYNLTYYYIRLLWVILYTFLLSVITIFLCLIFVETQATSTKIICLNLNHLSCIVSI